MLVEAHAVSRISDQLKGDLFELFRYQQTNSEISRLILLPSSSCLPCIKVFSDVHDHLQMHKIFAGDHVHQE